MDLRFTRRFVYLASAINIWGHDIWVAMSHKTTTCEGPGIASGSVVEGLVEFSSSTKAIDCLPFT